jgi:uncharacterized oligopeptide transporter (OPT) family protein
MAAPAAAQPRWRWLPPLGSWKYHLMLLVTGMLVLGPLAGLTASYMVFSMGFFVGGQVFAGILGSVVTFGYGHEGRHGANYIQTVAASVASMSAMGVLVQALAWLGLPQPALIPLTLYILCIGMFGAGVGMLYTPLLVDRLQLPFPSGFAVANILRALSDPVLLRRSIFKLGGGIALGIGGSVAAALPRLAALNLSVSTVGAGMIVGSRIAVPTLVGSLIFTALTPYFVQIGWLDEGDPYRKVTFLLAIGALLGTVAVDLVAMLVETVRRWRQSEGRSSGNEASTTAGAMSTRGLLLWTVVWGAGIVVVGHLGLHLPLPYLLIGISLVAVFGLINGVATGISDNNPVSAAFVVAVMLLATIGLRDPAVGLLIGVILFIANTVSTDMQQDRSTGWRLGSSRALQFRYQVAGLFLGSIAAIAFARLFLTAYPVLLVDQTSAPAAEQAVQWTSATTYKFVGALRSLTADSSVQRRAMLIGVLIGLGMQLSRLLLKSRDRYRRFVREGRHGRAADWLIDAVLLPSPYAIGFGAFINLATAANFAVGGLIAPWLDRRPASRPDASPNPEPAAPPDMSAASLLGGGLIAGEAITALALGVAGLITIAAQ